MSTFRAELIEALAVGRCIPFVGAGVPANVKNVMGKVLFPSWKELIEEIIKALRSEQSPALADEIAEELTKDDSDFAFLAQKARNALGPQPWNDLLVRIFSVDVKAVDDTTFTLPRALWSLTDDLIITTNFDNVLEQSLQDETVSSFDSTDTAEVGRCLRRQLKRRGVWHLHGTVDSLNSIILTSDDYQKLYGGSWHMLTPPYAGARLALDVIFATRQLLFVGYSLSDGSLVDGFKKVQQALPLGAARHFVMVRERETQRFTQRFPDVNVISFADYGTPLTQTIETLSLEVAEARKALPQSGKAMAAAQVHFGFRTKEERLDGTIIKAKADTAPSPRTAVLPTPVRLPKFSDSDPFVITFVSGKGGTGKTMLATACASLLSETSVTLLVDLDFFNRGLGQLVGEPGAGVAIDSLAGVAVGIEERSGWEIFQVRKTENLYVLSPKLDQIEEYYIWRMSLKDLCVTLYGWLMQVIQALDEKRIAVRALVLDCHGSSDAISLGAAIIAHHTMLVAEPEPFSAQGTIRFLRQLKRAFGQEPDVRLIINRISPGLSAVGLGRIFEARFEGLTSNPSPLAYFPEEEYLSRGADQEVLVTQEFPDSSMARRTAVYVAELAKASGRILVRKNPSKLSRFLARRTNGHLHWALRVDMTVRILAVGLVILFGMTLLENTTWIKTTEFENLRENGTWFLTIWSAVVLFSNWHFSLLRATQAAFHKGDKGLALRSFLGLLVIAGFGFSLGLLTVLDAITIRLPGIKGFNAIPPLVAFVGLILCVLVFVVSSFWRLRPRQIYAKEWWISSYRWALSFGYLVFLSAIFWMLCNYFGYPWSLRNPLFGSATCSLGIG